MSLMGENRCQKRDEFHTFLLKEWEDILDVEMLGECRGPSGFRKLRADILTGVNGASKSLSHEVLIAFFFFFSFIFPQIMPLIIAAKSSSRYCREIFAIRDSFV